MSVLAVKMLPKWISIRVAYSYVLAIVEANPPYKDRFFTPRGCFDLTAPEEHHQALDLEFFKKMIAKHQEDALSFAQKRFYETHLILLKLLAVGNLSAQATEQIWVNDYTYDYETRKNVVVGKSVVSEKLITIERLIWTEDLWINYLDCKIRFMEEEDDILSGIKVRDFDYSTQLCIWKDICVNTQELIDSLKYYAERPQISKGVFKVQGGKWVIQFGGIELTRTFSKKTQYGLLYIWIILKNSSISKQIPFMSLESTRDVYLEKLEGFDKLKVKSVANHELSYEDEQERILFEMENNEEDEDEDEDEHINENLTGRSSTYTNSSQGDDINNFNDTTNQYDDSYQELKTWNDEIAKHKAKLAKFNKDSPEYIELENKIVNWEKEKNKLFRFKPVAAQNGSKKLIPIRRKQPGDPNYDNEILYKKQRDKVCKVIRTQLDWFRKENQQDLADHLDFISTRNSKCAIKITEEGLFYDKPQGIEWDFGE